jgi:NAD(P)-dependent dehydrogenase (short-subunit alcohol dehydrogenase family)
METAAAKPAPEASSSVAGQVVVVVGASSGMGQAAVRALAVGGAHVVAAARRDAELRETVDDLVGRGLSALACPIDVADRRQVERLAQLTLETFGRADALIYAAGVNTPERALKVLPPEVWDTVLATNLTGAYHCTQVFLPSMLRQAAGLFIYISSLAVRRPVASGAAYAASKYGLKGLADSLLQEHHRDGIRCTLLIPGLTDTPLLRQRPVPTDPARLAAALQPEDIAAACRFLVGMPRHVRIPELVIEPARLP